MLQIVFLSMDLIIESRRISARNLNAEKKIIARMCRHLTSLAFSVGVSSSRFGLHFKGLIHEVQHWNRCCAALP